MKFIIIFCLQLCLFANDSVMTQAEQEWLSTSDLSDSERIHFKKKLIQLRQLIPAELRYKPLIPTDNSYPRFEEFLKNQDWPELSDSQRLLISQIEAKQSISTQDLKKLRARLALQEKLCLEALAIIRDKPLIFSPAKIYLGFEIFGKLRNTAYFLCNSSLIKFREGNHLSAINRVTEAYKLGIRMEQWQGGFTSLMVAQAIKNLAVKRILWILRQKNLSKSEILKLRAAVNIEEDSNRWRKTLILDLNFETFALAPMTPQGLHWMMESTYEMNKVMNPKSQKKLPPKPNSEDLNSYNVIDYMNDNLKCSDAFLADIKLDIGRNAKALEKVSQELQQLNKSEVPLYSPIDGKISLLTIMLKQRAYQRNKRMSMDLIAALRLYEIQTKRLPKTLNDLVKHGLIKSIPLDAWVGKPFAYDPNNRRLNFTRPNNSKAFHF